MFRSTRGGGRDPLLPTAGGHRTSNGGFSYGGYNRTPSKTALSNSFIATIAWALVSAGLIAGGFLYCQKNVESTSITCDNRQCQIMQLRDGTETLLTIPRTLLVRAEMVRIRNGEIVQPSLLKRSARKKLGHSYAVEYNLPESDDNDDESYDSIADDDDSYDSYENSQDSSEDDDNDGGDEATTIGAANRGNSEPRQPKKFESSLTPEERQKHIDKRRAEQVRKTEQRRKFAEDRRAEGKAAIHEPDEKRSNEPNGGGRQRNEDDADRFPGDAATMEMEAQRARQEIRNREQRMNQEHMGSGSAAAEAQRQAGAAHQERSRRMYEETAKSEAEKHRMHAVTKQRGNNMHDGRGKARVNSPDDPDNQPQPNGGDGPGEIVGQDAEGNLNVERNENLARQGGRRTLSAFGGMENVDTYSTREADVAEGEETAEEQEDYTTLGGVMHAGARGAGRKLMSWKNKAINRMDPRRRSRRELANDAAKERDNHRAGHGHHFKRKRRVAKTQEQEEKEKRGERTIHHHRSYHHAEDVPMKERHHVHPAYHHKPGEKPISGGWKHQHREWGGSGQKLTLLGTRFNLGRVKTGKRKELLNNYIFEPGPASRKTEGIQFSDSKRWRALGLWMMIVGSLSISFCLVIGNFQPRQKVKKVS